MAPAFGPELFFLAGAAARLDARSGPDAVQTQGQLTRKRARGSGHIRPATARSAELQ